MAVPRTINYPKLYRELAPLVKFDFKYKKTGKFTKAQKSKITRARNLVASYEKAKIYKPKTKKALLAAKKHFGQEKLNTKVAFYPNLGKGTRLTVSKNGKVTLGQFTENYNRIFIKLDRAKMIDFFQADDFEGAAEYMLSLVPPGYGEFQIKAGLRIIKVIQSVETTELLAREFFELYTRYQDNQPFDIFDGFYGVKIKDQEADDLPTLVKKAKKRKKKGKKNGGKKRKKKNSGNRL